MKPYFHAFGYAFPSYGVLCALGVTLGLALCLYRARRARLQPAVALVLFTGALAFGLLGALASYALVTYGFSGLYDMLSRGAFLREFSPGYIFYGGLASGLIAAWALCKILRADISDYASAMLPALPLAHACGRVGCYMAGCCYGVTTCEALGVFYPPDNALSSAPKGVPVLPVQLIEAALLLALCLLLIRRISKGSRALRTYVSLYAPMRFLLEFLRGDEIRGAFFYLSTSQWISLIALLLAIFPIKSRAQG